MADTLKDTVVKISSVDKWYSDLKELYDEIGNTSFQDESSGESAGGVNNVAKIQKLINAINYLNGSSKTASDKRVYFKYAEWSSPPSTDQAKSGSLISSLDSVESTMEELQSVCVDNSKSNQTKNTTTYNSNYGTDGDYGDYGTNGKCGENATNAIHTVAEWSTTTDTTSMNVNCNQHVTSSIDKNSPIGNTDYYTNSGNEVWNATTTDTTTTIHTKSYSSSMAQTLVSPETIEQVIIPEPKNGEKIRVMGVQNYTTTNVTELIQYAVFPNKPVVECNNIDHYVYVET